MNFFSKSAVAAGLALSAFAAPAAVGSAAAQVNGIATADPTMVIARAAARDAGYQQIQTTYSAQVAQIRQLRTELQTLQQALDTNNDRQVTQQELEANPTGVQQLQQKEQQIAQVQQPLVIAQHYVIEQLIADYNNARDQVIGAKRIQIILQPDAIQFGPPTMDVTTDIVNALNTRLPTVSTAVPANWRPRRETVQTHEAVQQIMMLAAAQAQAQQQQDAAQPQQPAGR